jgi:hypothetical protein
MVSSGGSMHHTMYITHAHFSARSGDMPASIWPEDPEDRLDFLLAWPKR